MCTSFICLLTKQRIYVRMTKDTILRSTINDYFENEPDGRLTAWVYPRPPSYQKRYLCGKMVPLWQIYFLQFLKQGNLIPQLVKLIVRMNVYPCIILGLQYLLLSNHFSYKELWILFIRKFQLSISYVMDNLVLLYGNALC